MSLLDSVGRAKELKTLFPRLGAYAAKVAIPRGVRIEPTLWQGHYAVWAEPDDLLDWVIEIIPVD